MSVVFFIFFIASAKDQIDHRAAYHQFIDNWITIHEKFPNETRFYEIIDAIFRCHDTEDQANDEIEEEERKLEDIRLKDKNRAFAQHNNVKISYERAKDDQNIELMNSLHEQYINADFIYEQAIKDIEDRFKKAIEDLNKIYDNKMDEAEILIRKSLEDIGFDFGPDNENLSNLIQDLQIPVELIDLRRKFLENIGDH